MTSASMTFLCMFNPLTGWIWLHIGFVYTFVQMVSALCKLHMNRGHSLSQSHVGAVVPLKCQWVNTGNILNMKLDRNVLGSAGLKRARHHVYTEHQRPTLTERLISQSQLDYVNLSKMPRITDVIISGYVNVCGFVCVLHLYESVD